jgi:hypothetical protein
VLPLQKAVALHHFEQFGTVGVVDVNANNDGPSRVVLGPLSLEDLVPMPADRNTEVIPVGRTPPASPASIDEEVDYMVAERLASLEGWRAFLAGHQRGAYAQSARAEVAQRLGASAATPGADPTDNRRGYGLSEQLASLASYAQFATTKVEQLLLADEAPVSGNPPISAQAPADERRASQPTNPVSSAAESAVPVSGNEVPLSQVLFAKWPLASSAGPWTRRVPGTTTGVACDVADALVA